jgi:hypothetical protein
MLACGRIDSDGKDGARLEEVGFGDIVALAPILSSTTQSHNSQSVMVPL